MRFSINAQTVLDDMRYVHEVLDEAGHLGLSDESAERIRAVVQRRIAELEVEISGQRVFKYGTIPILGAQPITS